MKGSFTIAARDLRSAFESPLAFILLAAFLVVSGLVFVFFLLSFSDLSDIIREAAAATKDATQTQRLSLDRAVVTPTLYIVAALLSGLAPLLTMRALAEERRQGTMELLLTSPVPAASIIAGKFLGALGIACTAVALTIAFPVLLIAVAAPDPGPLASGYLGLFLVAAAMTALGILASSLSESPVVAAFVGYAFILSSIMAGVVGNMMQTNLGLVLAWFSPLVHYEQFAAGIIDTADVAYYAIFTGAALFMALRVLDSHRWR